MAVKYYIRAGYVESNAPPKPSGNTTGPNAPLSNGKFDLHRWLKNELAFVGVANADPCCVYDVTNAPVRWNATAAHLQYLNSSGIWTAVPNV